MNAPRYDPVDVAAKIAALSRSPFRDKVVQFLVNGPSDGAIACLAERNPDRWAQALAIVARLGGFNEHLTIEGTLTHRIEALSDVELDAEITALRHRLEASSNVDDANPQ